MFSRKANEVSEHRINARFLNQFGLHQSFFHGHTYANYSAWLLYNLIHNRGRYSLRRKVLNSEMFINPDFFTVPTWTNPVGREHFWTDSLPVEAMTAENVAAYNLTISGYINDVTDDANRVYSSIKREHGQEFFDVARGGYNIASLRAAAAGLRGLVVRADLLNERGLQNMLGRRVGPVTAKRIIHLINNQGEFERAKVTWIDYTSKRFRMDIFRPE